MRYLFGLWALVSACGNPPHPTDDSSNAAQTCPSDMAAALAAQSPAETYIARSAGPGTDRCAFIRKDHRANH